MPPEKTYWQEICATFERLGGYFADPEIQAQLLKLTGEHLNMSCMGVLLAFAVGLTASLLASGRPRSELAVQSVANVFQTIPALALLAIFFAFMGSGYWTVVVTLALYAVLPVVKSCSAALGDPHAELLEAGRGMGMSPTELLWHIQIPQGLPVIISGLRIAFIYCIGSATLAAFIGAGGLGEYIYRGLSINNPARVLLGAIPIALLAIVIDLLLGLVEKKARAWKNGRPAWGRGASIS
ncbi:MAG: ABC transporter permease [Verrucomicrobiota bacterium]